MISDKMTLTGVNNPKPQLINPQQGPRVTTLQLTMYSSRYHLVLIPQPHGSVQFGSHGKLVIGLVKGSRTVGGLVFV